MAKTYHEDGTETNSISERNEKRKKLAMNQGPSTPVGVYDTADGGKMVMPKIQPLSLIHI